MQRKGKDKNKKKRSKERKRQRQRKKQKTTQEEDRERLREWEQKATTELHRKTERKRKSQGEGGRWWEWKVIKDRNGSDLPPQQCQVRAGSRAVGGQYLAGSSLLQQQPTSGSELPETCLQEVEGGHSAGITASTESGMRAHEGLPTTAFELKSKTKMILCLQVLKTLSQRVCDRSPNRKYNFNLAEYPDLKRILLNQVPVILLHISTFKY